jgi:GT2 family glycosyltransferase
MSEIQWPEVSVIIITKNRHAAAIAAARTIAAGDYPRERMEIIILEETDNPQPIPVERVRYFTIPEKNKGFAFARNQALAQAQHQIVAFTDDDCQTAPDWLRQLVSTLAASDQTVAVAGGVLVPPCGPVGQCENILGFPGGGVLYIHLAGGNIISRPTFSTCNCAVRKEPLLRAGGFPESLATGGEDQAVSRRLAQDGAILFNPRALVHHAPRDRLFPVLLWFIRRGKAELRVARRQENPGPLYRHMVFTSPFFRLAVLAGAGALLPVGPAGAGIIIAVALAVYYFSILRRYRWSRTFHPAIKTFVMLPLVKTVMDLGMSLGLIREALRRRKADS